MYCCMPCQRLWLLFFRLDNIFCDCVLRLSFRLCSYIWQLPPAQQTRVRHFIACSTASNATRFQEHNNELKLLSPPIAAAIVRHTFRRWLPEVYTMIALLFTSLRPQLILSVSLRIV
jgi:hypothetical protein